MLGHEGDRPDCAAIAIIAAELLATGIDCIVVDTAHGHSRGVIDAVRTLKRACGARCDLIAGNVQVMFAGLAPAVPQIKAGKIRALAVAGTKRSLVLPDAPSLAETLKGYDGSTWFAIFAPAGTPNDIIDRHASELARIMARKDVIDQLLQQGYEPWVMGPKELGAYVKEQIAKWAKVIKVAGIKGE